MRGRTEAAGRWERERMDAAKGKNGREDGRSKGREDERSRGEVREETEGMGCS